MCDGGGLDKRKSVDKSSKVKTHLPPKSEDRETADNGCQISGV